jgi:tetratricopeptide (TPR) repeat protein
MLALLLSALTQLPAAERVPIPHAVEAALANRDRRGAYAAARAALDRCGTGEQCLDLLIAAANLARGVAPADAAEHLARRAADDAARMTGDSGDTAAALNNLALLLESGQRFGEAEPLYRRALVIMEAIKPEDLAMTRVIAGNLADALEGRGRHVDAEPLRRRAAALAERDVDADADTRRAASRALAVNLLRQSRYADAEQVVRPLAEGPDAPAAELALLAQLLQNQGKAEAALPLRRRALALRTAAAGPDDLRTLSAASDLATTLIAMARPAEAEPIYRRTLDTYRQIAAGAGFVAIAEANLARALDMLGRRGEAEPLHRAAAAASAAAFGEQDEFTATMFANLAANLAAQGKSADAESYYRRALRGRRATAIETRTDWIDGHAGLARFLLAERRAPTEARSLLRLAQRGIETRLATFTDFSAPAQAELRGWRSVYTGQVAAAWVLARPRG